VSCCLPYQQSQPVPKVALCGNGEESKRQIFLLGKDKTNRFQAYGPEVKAVVGRELK